MTVYLDSRYSQDTVVRVLSDDGLRHPTVFRRSPPDLRFNYDEHLVVDGDRLDVLAYKAYGDDGLWWLIAEANPELDVVEPLPPGFLLRVPRAG